MIQRSVFGWSKPRIFTQRLDAPLGPVETMAPPQKVVLHVEKPAGGGAPLIQSGDAVQTGQSLQVFDTPKVILTSPVTGTVAGIESVSGDFGRTYWAVEIETAAEEIEDSAFADAADAPDMAVLKNFLPQAPGLPPLAALASADHPVKTLVVAAADTDLFTVTRRYVAANCQEEIKKGIAVLKAATGASEAVIALPQDNVQNVGGIGAKPKGVSTQFPAALPELVLRDVMGVEKPAEKPMEETGYCFISVEAVAAIGRAFAEKRIPVEKIVTVTDKTGKSRLIRVRIGTPVADLLRYTGTEINEADRIIIGGPMTGSAIYSLAHPVMADTDAILVQDGADLALPSDYPCINCGDCIRVCPANIQVNMLVRFLEATQYQAAADEYDLFSCVECGLCAFVCVAKIPILQYIRLGKYELARIQEAEAANA